MSYGHLFTADFQRRERVLEDLAQFKGALVILFFCHRDWLKSSGTESSSSSYFFYELSFSLLVVITVLSVLNI